MVWFLSTTLSAAGAEGLGEGDDGPTAVLFQPVKIPDWVHDVTRMAFITPGELELASKAGVQVAHANVVWQYYPLRKDGGGLSSQC